jgi:hypothetical protein
LSHSSPFFGDGSLKLFAWVASNHNPLEWLDYRHEPPAPGRSVFLIECQDYGGLRYQNLWAKEDPKTPKPIFPSLGVALPASCKARAFVGARRKPIIRKRLSKIWSSDLGKFWGNIRTQGMVSTPVRRGCDKRAGDSETGRRGHVSTGLCVKTYLNRGQRAWYSEVLRTRVGSGLQYCASRL